MAPVAMTLPTAEAKNASEQFSTLWLEAYEATPIGEIEAAGARIIDHETRLPFLLVEVGGLRDMLGTTIEALRAAAEELHKASGSAESTEHLPARENYVRSLAIWASKVEAEAARLRERG